MEFFETLHIELTKEMAKENITEDIVKILSENGYQVIGIIGRTEIEHKEKKHSDDAHTAWKKHYKDIKDSW